MFFWGGFLDRSGFSPSSYSCVLNAMCTVTASTVIDFTGHVHSVPDRCAYTLMSSLSIPGLQVLGVFQERRRRDVSFLDRVILELNGGSDQISLEQGGRVYVSSLHEQGVNVGFWSCSIYLSIGSNQILFSFPLCRSWMRNSWWPTQPRSCTAWSSPGIRREWLPTSQRQTTQSQFTLMATRL